MPYFPPFYLTIIFFEWLFVFNKKRPTFHNIGRSGIKLNNQSQCKDKKKGGSIEPPSKNKMENVMQIYQNSVNC